MKAIVTINVLLDPDLEQEEVAEISEVILEGKSVIDDGLESLIGDESAVTIKVTKREKQ